MKTTMGSDVVVVIGPGSEKKVSLLGVGPVSGIGPFAQSGLDEALRLAVGSGRVGFCAVMFDLHGLTGQTKPCGAVAGAVVGQQGAHTDAVGGEELDG